jgi:ATPase family associated with various cellular activities (AAA)
VIQSLSLARDWAKRGGMLGSGKSSHCIILLGTSFTLPAELSQDILSLDDAPPSEEEIKGLLTQVTQAAGLPDASPDTLMKSAEALLSLSSFAVEQEAAMSLTREGLNVDDLGERRRIRVESSPGLYMPRERPNFSSTGGYTEAKSFLTQLFAGPLGLRSIMFFDEIEKAVGATNDSSGVGLRMLGQLLTHMSLSRTSGILLHGVPGSGKTALAQACSGEFGVPFINCSLSEMQNSLVGQSEANLKRALEIDKSIGQGKSLWIATCNEVERIPAPLFRRFDLATFTFDLPNPEERASIWPIQLANYGLDTSQELPLDEGWTGSDIASCCKKAFALGVSVVEASKRVIPLSLSARKTIDKCHKEAEGCFLSSSYPGPFKMPIKKPGERVISLEDGQETQPQLVVINAAPSPFQFSPGEPQEPFVKKDKIGF